MTVNPADGSVMYYSCDTTLDLGIREMPRISRDEAVRIVRNAVTTDFGAIINNPDFHLVPDSQKEREVELTLFAEGYDKPRLIWRVLVMWRTDLDESDLDESERERVYLWVYVDAYTGEYFYPKPREDNWGCWTFRDSEIFEYWCLYEDGDVEEGKPLVKFPKRRAYYYPQIDRDEKLRELASRIK